MHRLAHDVVHATIEKCKGCFQRGLVADRDDRCCRPVSNRPGKLVHLLALPDQKGLDCGNVALCRSRDPFAEFAWIKPRGRDALAPKQ